MKTETIAEELSRLNNLLKIHPTVTYVVNPKDALDFQESTGYIAGVDFLGSALVPPGRILKIEM